MLPNSQIFPSSYRKTAEQRLRSALDSYLDVEQLRRLPRSLHLRPGLPNA